MIETNRTAFQKAVLKGAMEQANLRGAWLGIDLVALADNLHAVKRTLKPGTRLMAVVQPHVLVHANPSLPRRSRRDHSLDAKSNSAGAWCNRGIPNRPL